jgi:hypothetical protein
VSQADGVSTESFALVSRPLFCSFLSMTAHLMLDSRAMRFGRRTFLRSAVAALASAPATALAYGRDGMAGEEVQAPTSLEFRKLYFGHNAMGCTASAIAAIPKNRALGERFPLVVLLPGGHSSLQPHDVGCWCWWCEYGLGDCDQAMRKGTLDLEDFNELANDEEIARFNELLANKPFQGLVYVTPWILPREWSFFYHGAKISSFLRELVDYCRENLPVYDLKLATGIGGMSAGGSFALYCGAQCDDVFGTIIAMQPYSRQLKEILRDLLLARPTAQNIRILESTWDRNRFPLKEMVDDFRENKIDFDIYTYKGWHDQRYASGPGGLDQLLYFDRLLRGQLLDGSRRNPIEHASDIEISFAGFAPRNT